MTKKSFQHSHVLCGFWKPCPNSLRDIRTFLEMFCSGKKKMTIVRCSFSKAPNLELHPWAHSEAIAMVTESSDTDSLPGMIV